MIQSDGEMKIQSDSDSCAFQNNYQKEVRASVLPELHCAIDHNASAAHGTHKQQTTPCTRHPLVSSL
jgi:hypothetical protein